MQETPVLIPVRNSEVSAWKDCRQKWWWAYVEGLKSRQERTPLEFGTLMHAALEMRYPPGMKRGPKLYICVERVWEKFLDGRDGTDLYVKLAKKYGDEEGQVPMKDLAWEMAKNYDREYGLDSRYKVIASEQKFQVDVFHDVTEEYLFTAVGTMDGVWYDRELKAKIFVEHKTGAGLLPYGAPVEMDDQSGSYWAYGPMWLEHTGVIKSTDEFSHILFNRLRKAFADTRPTNEAGQALNLPSVAILKQTLESQGVEKPKGTRDELIVQLKAQGYGDQAIDRLGEVSKSQPEPLFKREPVYRTAEDRISVMDRFEAIQGEMRMVRDGELKVYKMQSKNCNGCEFNDMCILHEMGADWEAVRDSMFVNWDPYADHREALAS